jgi:pimeloyl-ACP methyl ester carboxylesterase
MYNQFPLTTLHTNGITVRAVVEGRGPLVIMVHGWPELWYSWRHQIKPIRLPGCRTRCAGIRRQ